jgi:alkylated DNA repair dioxygenase AlkB
VLSYQRSLLDSGAVADLRPLAGAVEHSELTEGAWVDVRRDWVTGADCLFEQLLTTVPWRAERRPMYDRVVDVPRLVSFYAGTDPWPDPLLARCRLALNAHYRPIPEDELTTVGLCLYRDGSDSVAWHGDTIGRASTEDALVAIVSLGARRGLQLRPRGGGPSRRFEVGAGDLLVMGGSCQRTWEHAVAKTRRPVGPRISLQFRPLGVT